MAPIVLLFAVVLAVDPLVFEQPHLKESVLLFLGPLLLLRSAMTGPLRRAASAPLPGPLLALAGLVGLSVFSSVVFADNRFAAARATALLFLGMVVLFAVHEGSYQRPLRLPAALLLAGAVAALVALLQATGVDFPFEDPDDRNWAVSLFGNSNLTGEFLAPLVPLAFVLVAALAGPFRLLALGALPLITAGVLVSGSRGALLALIVGLLAAAAGVRAITGARAFSPPALAGLAAGVVLALLAGGTGVFGFKSVTDSEASIASVDYPTNRQRLLLAQATVGMVAAAPLLGHGPGSFRAAFPPYRNPEEARVPTLGGARSEAEDPHDQYLLTAAEGGAVALLLLLWLLLPALLAARNAALLPGADPGRPAALAQAAALLTLLVVGLFRSFLAHPPSALLFFMLVGALLPYRHSVLADERERRRTSRLSWILPAYLLGVCVFGALALTSDFCQSFAHRLTREAAETGNRSRLLRALSWIDSATTVDPGNLYALQIQATTLRLLGGTESRVAEEEAVHRRILELYPWHEASLTRLGGLLADQDRVVAAIPLLRKALRLRNGPGAPTTEDYVDLLVGTGHPAGAARYLLHQARRADAGTADLRACAARAEQAGSPRLAIACHRAILDLYPYDGDSAYKIGELETALGNHEAARSSYARAQLSFGLEFLGQRNYTSARRAAGFSERHEPSLAAAVVRALAGVGEGDAAELEEVIQGRQRGLSEEFVAALRRLEGNGDLRAAIQRVVRELAE